MIDFSILVFIFIVYYVVINYLKNNIIQKRVIVSLEGNIAAGKSSMMELITNHFGKENAEYVSEPVDEWNDILKVFYEDKARWSYTFQSIAYITRLNNLLNTIKGSNKKYIFLDRSLKSDYNIFSKMLHDDGLINPIEWDCYNKWNNFYEKHLSCPDIEFKVIYLRCEPDIAFQRMQLRGREAEKNIEFEYLNSLHKYHETWLMNNNTENILIVDVNKNFLKNDKQFTKIYDDIIKFIN